MLFISVLLSLVLICAGIPSGIFQPGSRQPVVSKETSGSFSAWDLLYRLDVVSCSSVAAVPPLR